MISIITPNLDNGEYLEDNILSISKLDIPFEHIVVDGGSTDNSLGVLAKYPHIKVLHQAERTGMYGAIDMGFREAQGEYITWVNADDRIVAEGYEEMYRKAMDQKADVVYSDGIYNYVHDDITQYQRGRKWGPFFLRNGLIPTMQPSIIFSKIAYEKAGGMNFKNFKICGDLDLFVKLARLKDVTFKYIPVASSIFMKRGDSLGDLNHDRYLDEVASNNLPRPSRLARALFFIAKYV